LPSESTRPWTEELKRIAFVTLIAIGAASLLVSCGTKAGDEFIGSWKAAGDIDTTVISRRGDEFLVTNTGDPSTRISLQYEHGLLEMSDANGELEIRYDGKRDAITASVPGFPVGLILPRVK